jgi:hypothetical protein
MSTHTDYTPDEWEALKRAPVSIGLAVAYASNSGSIGTAREEGALWKAFERPGDEAQGTPLVMEVIASITDAPPAVAAVDSNDYLAQAIAACASARDVLAAKAEVNEAERYKTWLVSIGERIASVSKEGGFLGIGGKRVSDAEVAVINKITSVLYQSPASEREVTTFTPAPVRGAHTPGESSEVY